jgi:SAM-dependent methyltransferase
MNREAQMQPTETPAEIYERHMVPAMLASWVPALLDLVALKLGERVLDVACGTGAVARQAALQVGPGGQAVGLDFNSDMLALARARGPAVEWPTAGGTLMTQDMQPPPQAIVRQLCMGLRASQVAYIAAKLQLPDHLADHSMTSGQLAAVTNTDHTSLRRVLRALVALGVMVEEELGLFSLTPVGQLLRSDNPHSLQALVLFLTGDVRWRCWGDLLESVRTGEPATQRVLGMSGFDFGAANPEYAKISAAAMAATSATVGPAICQAYDFSRFSCVVDVGGGSGQFLTDILRANPGLQGILFDLPHIVAQARPILSGAGVADRCRIQAGSFFEGVPVGADAYVLKYIIHDWDDPRAGAILAACRRAMAPDGAVIVVERLLPERAKSGVETEVYFIDLEMLATTPGGRERTEAEFRQLFAAAGFALEKVVPTASPFRVFEGRPV